MLWYYTIHVRFDPYVAFKTFGNPCRIFVLCYSFMACFLYNTQGFLTENILFVCPTETWQQEKYFCSFLLKTDIHCQNLISREFVLAL